MKDNNLLSSNPHQIPTVSQASSYSSPLLDSSSDIDLRTLIDEDLKLIPEFTTENVLQYFIYKKECDGLERQVA